MRLTIVQQYKIGLNVLGLSNLDLARELGFSKSYVNMLINKKRSNELFDNWMETNVLPLFERKKVKNNG
jgi:hypothetical protein